MSGPRSFGRPLAGVALAAALVFGLFPIAMGADTAAPAEVRLRNIVRRKLPRDARVIGMEFTVLRVDDAGNQQPVDPASHAFRIGDSFLVKIKPQDDLYVYVFTEGPGETGGQHRACLLPDSPAEPLLVKAGTEVTLPENDGLFTFEPPAGEEKFVVVALREPNADLNLIAAAAFKEPGAKLMSTEEKAKQAKASAAVDGLRTRADEVRLRGSRKKLEQAIESIDPKGGPGVFETPPDEASPSTEVIGVNTSEIIVDIPLKSRPERK